MSSIPTADEIARDARWLTQAFDPKGGVVRLVEMDRAAYREASFLDDRMFQREFITHLVPLASVAEAAQLINRRDARWIFHLSHVGSTLIARLLGEFAGILCVREPAYLRALVQVPAPNRAGYAATAQRLFSRTFTPDEAAIIKTTSFLSEIAPELVPAGGRALNVYVTPRNFVSNILAGENSVKELRNRAEGRARRLLLRDIVFPHPRNEADLAVAAWACEMTSLQAAAEAMSDRQIGWIDFDVFLEDVQAGLAASAHILGIPSDPAQLSAIANSPLNNRYSKAPQFEYTPALRRDLIAEATRRHGREIEDALAMLPIAAEKSPVLERALARSRED